MSHRIDQAFSRSILLTNTAIMLAVSACGTHGFVFEVRGQTPTYGGTSPGLEISGEPGTNTEAGEYLAGNTSGQTAMAESPAGQDMDAVQIGEPCDPSLPDCTCQGASAVEPTTPDPAGNPDPVEGGAAPVMGCDLGDGQACDGTTTAVAAGSSGGLACSLFSLTTVLSSEPANEYLPSRQWSFAVSEETLYVHVAMTGISQAAHTLILDFHVPDGYLYARRRVLFLAGEVSGGIQGYPWHYVQAREFPEGYVVSYALPLAGSQIQSSGLVGGWRLAAYLDTDTNPVASVWFEVTAD